MARILDPRIDDLDLKILTALEADGRLQTSALARKIGTSRGNAGRRLQRLLDEKISRVSTFTNPRALGYQAAAMIGIRVLPGQLNTVAEELCRRRGVLSVVVGTGRHDILIWTLFTGATEIAGFLDRELGSIAGIMSTETTIIIGWNKVSFAYASPHGEPRKGGSKKRIWADFSTPVSDDSGMTVDETDLKVLRALEADGRKPVSSVAKEIHTSRANVAARLQRLLDDGVATIVCNTSPLALGYRMFAMIGIKVTPSHLGAVVGRVCGLPNVYWVMTVAGRHDIVAWTMFADPSELAAFMANELGSVAGIASTETTIALELRKMAFPYLASDYLVSNPPA